MKAVENRLTIPVAEGLLMKEIEPGDAEVIFNTISHQRNYLRRWLPFVDMTWDIEDTLEYIYSVENSALTEKTRVFTIYYKKSFAGVIGLTQSDMIPCCGEIGYWLHHDFQKKGIATRCVYELSCFALERLWYTQVCIQCAAENYASRKIPQRLGFNLCEIRKKDMIIRGKVMDVEVYILKEKR